MTRRAKLFDDSGWKEVAFANKYALFIGYLSMAVKGLGFLVLTWTTVVLLGGFVSTLQKKDFWCLTFITLVQTAGLVVACIWFMHKIFDVFLTEKLSYIGDSFWGVLSAGYAVASSNPFQLKCPGLGDAPAMFQVVVFCIVLCPLAVIYMFGLLISAGISLWRLRQHDYGSDADGVGNLKSALDVLYSLALLQGVIFSYKAIFGFAKGSVVNTVVELGTFDVQSHSEISDYLLQTVTGCEKDPSFARGRNLITYAVDLMGSKSPDDYISGVMILDAFARGMEKVGRSWEEDYSRYTQWSEKTFMQEHILLKHLVMSASSTDILKKLLQTLSLTSIYDRETRDRAARIVANIAMGIRLEEFPRAIHYISSLIHIYEVYRLLQPYQRDWVYETYEQDWYAVAGSLAPIDSDKQESNDVDLLNSYMELMVQGFRILRKLAASAINCRIMLDTPCLLHKIMAPVTSDLLHQIDHGAWYNIVQGSLKVIAQLLVSTEQTGNKLCSEISSCTEAINTMERILECEQCDEKLQTQVISILTHLYKDTSSILEAASRERFIRVLVEIVTDNNKHKRTSQITAAKGLVGLASNIENGSMVIMKAKDNVVHSITTMTVEKHGRLLSAAPILEYLCCHYTNNDESLQELKKTMIHAIPKLFGEILCWASEKTHVGTGADQDRFPKPETDIESQDGVSRDNGRGNNSSCSNQPGNKMNDYEVLLILSLCVTVCDTFINADEDLAHHLDAIAPGDGALSFPRNLEEIVKKNMRPREDCLKILKLTCKMVISMMKHRGTYVKEDLESLMDALSTASKDMFLLDGSMAFHINQDDATKLKPFRSLASLVKEAQVLVDKHYGLSS